ncbi:uncharacterized protein LOC134840482 isoform X2 [Symsagittifera roscoffensis]|uniref:uncharacterized protein LOC134840482 isoform X2 n=1 Tax=Symsagittifera roscoffensis TaxID=84072 RepID=UPI00307C1858
MNSRRLSRNIEKRIVLNFKLDPKKYRAQVPTEKDVDHARKIVEDLNLSVATLRHLVRCVGSGCDTHILREDIASVAERAVTMADTCSDLIAPHIRNECLLLHPHYRLLGTMMTGCIELLEQEVNRMHHMTKRYPDPETPTEEHMETCALYQSESESDCKERLKVLLTRLRDIPRTKVLQKRVH